MLETIQNPGQLKNLTLDQKQALAREIRDRIIQTTLKNGGHLSSNLGAVELTIALHSVLSAPEDKLLFDVGHQCYAHKLLTGRCERFDTLRRFQGLSGFTRPDESVYDTVASGHASDSISLALGFAKARDIKKENYNVAAVLGDGALTGGMCYEALNDAGQSKTRMLIVLNDNEMSISKNVGSMSRHLTHMRQSGAYRGFKQFLRKAINRLPKGGNRMERFFSRVKDSLKALLVSDMFFDSLDIEYLGPIDGHDISEMEKVFRTALTYDRPVVVHVVTRKGKGYAPAEENPSKYHGVSPAGEIASGVSCASVVGRWLCERAETDERVAGVSAAMLSGTGLEEFSKRFPERCFDVGIAEEHAAAMAAGLALSGLRPFVALYSTFMQRAYDQIGMDVCLNRAPVTLLIDRSGLNGADGETHQGVFDTALLKSLPNLTVCAPSNTGELRAMLEAALESSAPFAIKYPKTLPEGEADEGDVTRWKYVIKGGKVCVISYGRMVSVALKAAEMLKDKGLAVSVLNARTLNDTIGGENGRILREASEEYGLLAVLEDSAACGGLGESVSGAVGGALCLGVPDRFIPAGSIDEQLKYCALDAGSVCERVLQEARARGIDS